MRAANPAHYDFCVAFRRDMDTFEPGLHPVIFHCQVTRIATPAAAAVKQRPVLEILRAATLECGKQYLERFPFSVNRRDSHRAANKIVWPSWAEEGWRWGIRTIYEFE